MPRETDDNLLGTESPSKWRTWLPIALLLCLPAFVLLRSSNAIFPRPEFPDTWIYLGFLRNLVEFKRYLFNETYYATRLSWIVPGALVHRILPALAANWVLHLGVFYLFIFSLYSALSRLANRGAALIAAVVAGFYPYLWRSTGHDYVDGVGIAYFTAAFALLTRAASSEKRGLALTFAGVLAAAAVWSNLFWGMLVALIAIHYCAMTLLRAKGKGRAFVDLAVWFTAGFLALTAILAAINYQIEGTVWFFIPSVRFLQTYSSVSILKHYPPFGWPLNQYLKYPFAIFATACVVFAMRIWQQGVRRNAQALLVVGHLGLLLGIFVGLEARGTSVLTLEYYASYLIPFTFLALGVTLPRLSDAPREVGILAIGLIVACGCTWWIDSDAAPTLWTLAGTLPVCALIALACLLHYRPVAAAAGVLGFALLTYSVRPAPAAPSEHHDVWERVMQTTGKIEARRQGRPVRFWYDRSEPGGDEFRTACSVYVYNYSLASESFPALPGDRDVEPGVLMVMPTHRADAPARALEALRTRGMAGTVEDAGTIGEGPGGYRLFLMTPQFDTSAAEGAAVTLDPGGGEGKLISGGDPNAAAAFPAGGWALSESPGAWMRTLDRGILIHTSPKSYYTVSRYKRLTAESEGDYHFMLRYTADTGNLALGVLKGDDSGWIDARVGTLLGEVSTVGLTVHLKQGEQFRLALTNSHAHDEASQFAVKEVTATRLRNGHPQ